MRRILIRGVHPGWMSPRFWMSSVEGPGRCGSIEHCARVGSILILRQRSRPPEMGFRTFIPQFVRRSRSVSLASGPCCVRWCGAWPDTSRWSRRNSPAARVFAIVVGAWGQPGVVIRQIVGHDGAVEIVEMKRNLRVLSAMASLGPLLGLLGTVVGIIQSFDALGGRVGPSRGEALAHGISLALVATAFGLAIAIVSMVFYYVFLNRVDLLVGELDRRARQVIELVAAEAHRGGSSDRRHLPIGPSETQRYDSRGF